jgi:hypothetical protein
MLVDFDGPSADLQQLAQTFVQAVKIPPPNVTTVSALPPPSTAGGPKSNGDQPTLFDNVAVEEAAAQQPEAVPAAPKPQNGSKRRHKTPEIISDLDCATGGTPLADFVKEYEPKTQQALYLVIVKWLKEHKSIVEVSDRHIFTCYMFLRTPVPEDVGSGLRALNRKKFVEHGSASGFYKLTHIGESELLRMRNKE